MILVKIKDVNDCDIITELLKAKEFFNMKNITVDIIILNEEKNVYEQYVKEKIEAEIFNKHLEYLINQNNGIFILKSNEMEKKDIRTLFFRANIMLDASKGNIRKPIGRR